MRRPLCLSRLPFKRQLKKLSPAIVRSILIRFPSLYSKRNLDFLWTISIPEVALQALTVAACKWHENEIQRRSKIQKVLDDVGGLYLSAETIAGTEYKTDGNLRVNIMPPVIRKCKNEAGRALLEAIAYYVQFLVKVLDRRGMRSRFPSILLIDTGKVVHCITTWC